MKNKSFSIYKISRGYRQCAVWYANESHVRVGRSTVTPFKELPRKQRYDEIAKFLKDAGIPVPPYEPTKAEASRKNER